ncbi:DUF6731 family protein [Solitalea lacus]|uniref:DUF6731 family protein n=1 Tax=Solitalea lacus TaxID=2911172 RepID=UPI001EDBD50D|nr:DUF6731 family protein [Solitalea lacus]UKJ07921.1 hypothetical protein L2B55_01855 [Solitalea lacus]
MAKKKKRLEVVTVTLRVNDYREFTFADFLMDPEISERDIKLSDRYVRLKYLEDCGDYIVGLVQTTKMQSTPPKNNVTTGVLSPLGLTNVEGLAYPNVFLFEKHRGILLYEISKEGTYLNQFEDVIYRLSNDTWYKPFDINFKTVYNVDSLEKLLSMGEKKTLEIEVANPDYLIRKSENEGKAVGEVLKPGKDLGADNFKIIASVGARTSHVLNGGFINSVLSGFQKLIPQSDGAVKHIKLKGYTTENKDSLTEVDLVIDTMKLYIKVNERKNMADLQPTERKQEIQSAYRSAIPDFDLYFNKLEHAKLE